MPSPSRGQADIFSPSAPGRYLKSVSLLVFIYPVAFFVYGKFRDRRLYCFTLHDLMLVPSLSSSKYPKPSLVGVIPIMILFFCIRLADWQMKYSVLPLLFSKAATRSFQRIDVCFQVVCFWHDCMIANMLQIPNSNR